MIKSDRTKSALPKACVLLCHFVLLPHSDEPMFRHDTVPLKSIRKFTKMMIDWKLVDYVTAF